MLGAGSVFESWALACTPQLRFKMMRKTVVSAGFIAALLAKAPRPEKFRPHARRLRGYAHGLRRAGRRSYELITISSGRKVFFLSKAEMVDPHTGVLGTRDCDKAGIDLCVDQPNVSIVSASRRISVIGVPAPVPCGSSSLC